MDGCSRERKRETSRKKGDHDYTLPQTDYIFFDNLWRKDDIKWYLEVYRHITSSQLTLLLIEDSKLNHVFHIKGTKIGFCYHIDWHFILQFITEVCM